MQLEDQKAKLKAHLISRVWLHTDNFGNNSYQKELLKLYIGLNIYYLYFLRYKNSAHFFKMKLYQQS